MRRLLAVLVTAVLVLLVCLTVSRVLETRIRWLVLAASFSPYAVVGYTFLLLVCLFLWLRRRGGAVPVVASVVCALCIGIHAVWLGPLFFGAGSTGGSSMVVMTSNLDGGQGDPRAIMGAVRQHHVEVLVLEEVTPAFLARLRALGVDAVLPQQSGSPSQSDTGTMVFSHYRLGTSEPLPLSKGGQVLDVQATRPFRLLVVHTSQPVKHPAAWSADLATIRREAGTAVQAGPTLVVGDFNATRDHRQLRDILALGLRDAAEQSGAGWQPTWPTRDWNTALRPVLAIDHVLTTRPFVTEHTWTVEPEDSDHLALVARIATTSD